MDVVGLVARALLGAMSKRTGRGPHLHVGCGFRRSVSTPVRHVLGTLRPSACLPPRHRGGPSGRRVCLILHNDLLTVLFSRRKGIARGMGLGPRGNVCKVRVPPYA